MQNIQDKRQSTQVVASGYYTCALKLDNTVQCWGYNGYQGIPTDVVVKKIALGSPAGINTCVIKPDNTVACWGTNDYGQSIPPVGLTAKQL